MQQNATRQERAAILVAEDELTEEQIAAAVGVHRVTVARWKRNPDFQTLVGDAFGEIRSRMLRLAIAKKHKRLAALNDLHTKALGVIDARAADMADDAPGADTGLLVRQFKQIGSGRDARVVEEYTVDVGLIREIRALEEQAARELGQWEERLSVDQKTSLVRIVGVDVEAL